MQILWQNRLVMKKWNAFSPRETVLLQKYEESKLKYIRQQKLPIVAFIRHDVLAVWLILDNFKWDSNLKLKKSSDLIAFIGR